MATTDMDVPNAMSDRQTYGRRGATIGALTGLLTAGLVIATNIYPNVTEHKAIFPFAVILLCSFCVGLFVFCTLIGFGIGNNWSSAGKLKSFTLDRGARTHWTGILLAWSAFVGACSIVGLQTWIQYSRSYGWYLARDPNPDNWTRSYLITLVVGCILGIVVGSFHILIRRPKKRA